MDREEMRMSQMTLPEALVEKIIAMMPYPSIFKARCLSKSWLARFSSISSFDVEEEKWLATSFQKEVSKWSRNWDTFYPVVVRMQLKVFLTYKRGSQKWSRIPSLSFLPLDGDLLTQQIEFQALDWQIEGPLLYGIGHLELGRRHFFVANVLTRSWRQLPPRPDALETVVLYHKVVIHPSSETYKVILLVVKFCPENGVGHYYAQIFDSKIDAWNSGKHFEASTDFRARVFNAAHLDGVLYMVPARNPLILLAFNLEEGTVEEITLSLNNDKVLRATTVTLVVCNVDWLMLVIDYDATERDAVQVFKIEVGDGRLVPLTMSPREGIYKSGFELLPPAGDGNCILFWKLNYVWTRRRKEKLIRSRVEAYNVDDDVWTSFPGPEETTAGSNYGWSWCFRPGLSPFVSV